MEQNSPMQEIQALTTTIILEKYYLYNCGMDKFFMNDIIRRIWRDDFKGNSYEMAKHLGHVDKRGKVKNQKVDMWIKNKAVIRPESFVETLKILGYTFDKNGFSRCVKK